MDRLEREYAGQLTVEYVDIEDRANRRLVSEYQATSIPLTVIFNRNGRIIATFRGLTNEEHLSSAIDRALAN